MKDSNYYKALYDRFIETRSNRVLDNCNIEVHHIVPRCMGGGEEESNLIALSPREHFLAHLFLNRAYPEHKGITKAHQAMFKGSSKQQNNRQFTSRFYQLIREKAFPKIPPQSELEELYYNQKLSYKRLGERYGVSDMTVCKWFKILNIKALTIKDRKWELPDKQELKDSIEREAPPYIKTRAKYGVGRTLLYNWMKEYSIGPAQRRGLDAMNRIPPKKELEALVVKGSKQETKFVVMREYKCGIKTALKWLNHYNIDCKNKKPKVRVTLCCKMCSESFEVKPYQSKRRQYCSPECARKRYSC